MKRVPSLVVERIQTGVRLEKRLTKVLKALAEYYDLSLGDLLEGIVLHAFDGKLPFDAAARERIIAIKAVYGLDLDSSASHKMVEASGASRTASGEPVASRMHQNKGER